ncbi:uncharacterized protein RAG0_16819 [Rhynchosporium agropyri]|uniref:Uncharacterized protein n=1 Tax=Rhynchosporium agropyri TaxID=914238 RepID=A0A1E1LS26_9HELO|nr:uncharacterized protein RAG0_16819 [Rhynchosporium agropyri]
MFASEHSSSSFDSRNVVNVSRPAILSTPSYEEQKNTLAKSINAPIDLEQPSDEAVTVSNTDSGYGDVRANQLRSNFVDRLDDLERGRMQALELLRRTRKSIDDSLHCRRRAVYRISDQLAKLQSLTLIKVEATVYSGADFGRFAEFSSWFAVTMRRATATSVHLNTINAALEESIRKAEPLCETPNGYYPALFARIKESLNHRSDEEVNVEISRLEETMTKFLGHCQMLEENAGSALDVAKILRDAFNGLEDMITKESEAVVEAY